MAMKQGATPPHTFHTASRSTLPGRLLRIGLGMAVGGLLMSASVARSEPASQRPANQLVGRVMVTTHQDLALVPDLSDELEPALQRSMEMQRLDQLIQAEVEGVAERVSIYRNLLEAMGSGPLGSELSRKADQLASYRRVLQARTESEQEVIRPRKRNIATNSLQAVPTPSTPQALATLDAQERACRNLLYKLGDDARGKDQLPTAFRVWGRALRMEPNGWATQSATRQSAFLDAAVFMITSARASEEVQALYEQLGLDTAELNRRTIAQMERWLTLYAQAPSNLTSFGGTRQTLTDMLYLLGDDTGVASLLAEKDRNRLLNQLALSASERGQYAEAVGAWTRLQDTESLKKLGRRLSKNILVESEGRILVQREVALAIEALAEADDSAGLKDLLERVRAAEARVKALESSAESSRTSNPNASGGTSVATQKATLKVVNRESLQLYSVQLTRLVEEGAPVDDVLAALSRMRTTSNTENTSAGESLQQLSQARLEELVNFYSQQAMTLPGEQRRSTSETLKGLEEEALRRNLPALALTAAMARDDAGLSLVSLGGHFLQTGEWELAYKAYHHADKQGIAGLRALGDRLTENGSYLVRGAFNPLISIAVDAYLEADAVDRLESVYMELQMTRARILRAPDPQAIGLSELDATIKSIQAVYELEPQLVVTPPTPVKDVASSPKGSTPAKAASQSR